MFFASYIKHVFMLFIVPFLCCFFQQDQSIVVCHFKNVTEQGYSLLAIKQTGTFYVSVDKYNYIMCFRCIMHNFHPVNEH